MSKNDIGKVLNPILSGKCFRSVGIGVIFYGFVNYLALFLTVNMNEGLMKCDRIILAKAVDKGVDFRLVKIDGFFGGSFFYQKRTAGSKPVSLLITMNSEVLSSSFPIRYPR